MSGPRLDEGEVDYLMDMVGADPSNAKARRALHLALDAIPGLVAAKENKRPQSTRNKSLEKLSIAAAKLRVAFQGLDIPTRAALFEASWRGAMRHQQFELDGSDDGGLDPQHDTLSRLLGEDSRDARVMRDFLTDLEAFARAATREAEPGRPSNEGEVEAVRVLVWFVNRYGVRPSVTLDGAFHDFAQRAFRLATGEKRNRNLLRAVRSVLGAASTVGNETHRL
jgi:hypothetical protein